MLDAQRKSPQKTQRSLEKKFDPKTLIRTGPLNSAPRAAEIKGENSEALDYLAKFRNINEPEKLLEIIHELREEQTAVRQENVKLKTQISVLKVWHSFK
jgi:hypothetical protein